MQAFQKMKPALLNDAPGVQGVMHFFQEETKRLADIHEGLLVHGDFYDENVLLEPSGSVASILDFSGLTVAGDPRMDLTFIAFPSNPDSADARYVRSEIVKRHGKDILDVLWLYRLY